MITKKILEISEIQFAESFLNFNFATKAAISHLLCEKLREDTSLQSADIKSIIIQVLENYFNITETVIMFLIALRSKKEDPSKSFIFYYNKTFIREKNGDTKKILSLLSDTSVEKFLEVFGLASFEELTSSGGKEVREQLENIFGGKENALEQLHKELHDLLESLKLILSNRIRTNDEYEFPFFKVLNKIKHGMQILDNDKENNLYILLDPVESENDMATFETVAVKVDTEIAYFFSEQSKIMARTIEHLLRIYILSL